jgi:hypothetical protein
MILSETIPADKLFLYQVADASRPLKPVESRPSHPPRMAWSRSSRLFPFENELGGYLPVPLFTEMVVKTGYQGWWSLEMFNTSLEDQDEECPRRHGIRGLKGLRRLWRAVQGAASQTHEVAVEQKLPLNSTWGGILQFMRGLIRYLHAEWVFRLPCYFRASYSGGK